MGSSLQTGLIARVGLTALTFLMLAGQCVAQAPRTAPITQLMAIPPTSGVWDMQAETTSGRIAKIRIANNHPDLTSPIPYAYDKGALLQQAARKLRNLDLLRKQQSTFETAIQREKAVFFPEYGSSLREVVLTLDVGDQYAATPLQRHLPIIRALPGYTSILLLVPHPMVDVIQGALRQESLERRATIIPVQTNPALWQQNQAATETPAQWIRDAMLVGRLGSDSVIYAPIAHRRLSDISASENAFLYDLAFSRRLVLPLPLFIRGGNYIVAETDQAKYGFIGEDEILLNESAFLQSFGFKPPRHAFTEILRLMSGIDEVVVLPNTETMPHIGLAMVALGNKNIGVIAPVDTLDADADDLALARIRSTLTDLGFTIVPIPTTAARMNQRQSPVNVVTFIDKSVNQPALLMPRFPDETVVVEGQSKGLNTLVNDTYTRAGFRTTWIEDRHGNPKGYMQNILYELD